MVYNKNSNAFAHLEPANVEPIQVFVDDCYSVEDAIRKFKAKFQRERIIGQLKEKSAYEKPSEKKRRKKREAVERRLFAESRERMIANGEWDKRLKKRQEKQVEGDSNEY